MDRIVENATGVASMVNLQSLPPEYEQYLDDLEEKYVQNQVDASV